MQTAEFASLHPPREPRKLIGPSDADRPLGAGDGVMHMPCANDMLAAATPGADEGRHLWVILPDAVPVILEVAPDVQPPPLESGKAKHTNLTGGGDACCGGEVWVDDVDATLLYLNGGSGRYPPGSIQQLDAAVEVFEQMGYTVRSAGWDDENDWPARTFRT